MLNKNYRPFLNLIILPLLITSFAISSESFAQAQVNKQISIWPSPPPRKPKTSRSLICTISPPYSTYIVWHDRPLFLWKYSGAEKKAKLVLREYDGNQAILWEPSISLTAQKMLYGGSTPLEAGKLYQWRLVNAENKLDKITDWQTIQIMAPAERDKIQSDLQALEQKLKVSKASSEEIAVQKAVYFSKYQIQHQNSEPTNLWSDVLQSLHEVDKPSTEYSEQLKQYTNKLCEQK